MLNSGLHTLTKEWETPEAKVGPSCSLLAFPNSILVQSSLPSSLYVVVGSPTSGVSTRIAPTI